MVGRLPEPGEDSQGRHGGDAAENVHKLKVDEVADHELRNGK